MAKDNKKIYVLEICYDEDQGEIEYIEEFITGVSSKPAVIPLADVIEVDDEYWEIDTNIIGES